MFDPIAVIDAMLPLVGWKQNPDPNGWKLDTGSVILATNGLSFNGVHPLLTINNMAAIAPRFDDFTNTPAERNTAFTDHLLQKTRDVLLSVVNDWTAEKFQNGSVVNILQDTKLWNDDYETTPATVTVNENLVGIRITNRKHPNVTMTLKRVSLAIKHDSDVTVGLYRIGVEAPISTVEVAPSVDGHPVWVETNWVLNSHDRYYVAYVADGAKYYNYSSGHYSTPVFATHGLESFVTTPGIGINVASAERFGLNLDLTVSCDYSQFLIKNAAFFTQALLLGGAVQFMRELAFNADSRLNRDQLNIEKAEVMYEVEGDSQGGKGSTLYARYKKALAQITFDTTSIDSVCLPCKKTGITFGVIGGH
jgi:hypothetical protein